MKSLQIIEIQKHEESYKYYSITKNLDDIINEIENFNVREMYLVDRNFCFDISSIILKENCILLKLDYIRAIIFMDKAYIIENKNNEIEIKLNNTICEHKFFHLTIIDYLFTEISNYFVNEITQIAPKISNNNENIKNKNYSYTEFISIQSELTSLEYRIKELRTLIAEMVDNKEDIKDLAFNKDISLSELEEMMENYYHKFQDINYDIDKLTRETDNIQKIVNIDLAIKRNTYAKFNIYISIFSVSISMGSFIGSMYGMNLTNHLEDNHNAFYPIFMCSIILILLAGMTQIHIFNHQFL